jgi:hypothetical protein
VPKYCHLLVGRTILFVDFSMTDKIVRPTECFASAVAEALMLGVFAGHQLG